MLNKNLIGIITNYVGFYKGINFNIPFFEKHISSCEQLGVPNKINWSMLSENTNIPFTFFEKHLDKVDWFWLSGNPNIPVTFFEKYLDKVDWSYLSGNTNIPFTFFNKHLALQSKEMNIKVDWSMLSGNTNIPKHYNLIKLREILYNYKL